MGTDCPDKTDNHILDEKSAAPVGAIDQVLAMLGDLSDRMNRMEVARKEQSERTKRGHRSQSSVRPWEL
uniref:Uncharacterized protein n=1 Tax=Peronospora matthiolae TaxID=2874970 RepID=A0AAV1UWA3_9STRA